LQENVPTRRAHGFSGACIRPRISSPEFAPYFENRVKTSKSRGEAVRRLGYHDASTIYHHLRRLGMEAPSDWSRRPDAKLTRQDLVPAVIIPTLEPRAWVAALVQGEGSLECHHLKRSDSTTIDVVVGMTDPAPIFKLSDHVGLSRPARPKRNRQWQPVWRKSISGLRALRLLREILPFLVGQKQREAQRAVQLFSPDGYMRGHFTTSYIWPAEQFPLRKHGPPRK